MIEIVIEAAMPSGSRKRQGRKQRSLRVQAARSSNNDSQYENMSTRNTQRNESLVSNRMKTSTV